MINESLISTLLKILPKSWTKEMQNSLEEYKEYTEFLNEMFNYAMEGLKKIAEKYKDSPDRRDEKWQQETKTFLYAELYQYINKQYNELSPGIKRIYTKDQVYTTVIKNITKTIK